MSRDARTDPVRFVPRRGWGQLNRQAAPWDRLAPGYDARFTGPVALAEDMFVRDRLRTLLHRMPPETIVVDLGCGTGHLLDILPELAPHRYLGLDVSSSMLDLARARHPGHQFRVRDFRDVLRASRPALVACLYGTPSYVPDPLGAFHAWARAASPGDLLFWMFSSPSYLRRGGHVVGAEQLTPLVLPEVVRSLQAVQDATLDSGVFGFSPPLRLPALPRALHGTRLARLLVRAYAPILVAASRRMPEWPGHTYWCVTSRRLVRADGQ